MILIHDTPRPRFDVPTCLSRADWHGENPGDACTFEPNNELENQVAEQEVEAVRGMTGVVAIDMATSICPTAPCTVQRDGVIAYHDSHHLTATFSATLADDLEDVIFRSIYPPQKTRN